MTIIIALNLTMKIYKLFTIALVSLYLGSCNQDLDYQYEEPDALTEQEFIESDGLTLEQKFENIQGQGQSVLARSLDVNNTDLNLIDYKYVKKINTKEELEQVKQQIQSNESVFPYYDIDNKLIALLTWDGISESKQYEQIQYSKDRLLDYLNKNLNVGMEQFELTWQSNGKTYKTVCITSGDEVIYDNIISNTICLSDNSQETLEANETMLLKTRQEGGGSYSSTKLVVDKEADWLWGSERGRVRITHTIFVIDGGVDSSTYDVDAYITLGNSDARGQIIELKRGVGGFSRCNYAYYLTTPAMSATISGGGGISFSVSVSGIGSKIYGSGDDVLYAL